MRPLLSRALARLRRGAPPASGAMLFYANSSQSGGFTLMDALILGLVVFVAFRLFSMGSRRRPPGSGRPQDRPGPAPRTRPTDRYEAAQSAWEALASRKPDASAPSPARAEGFDAQDFLKGAKAAMMRVHQAVRDGDFKDAAHFTSPRLLEELKSRPGILASDKDAAILLMEADLLDSSTQGDVATAKVRFATTEGSHGSQAVPKDLVRVVDFVRDAGAADPHWKMDRVRMEGSAPQGPPS